MLIFDVENALQMCVKRRHVFRNRVNLPLEIHLKMVPQPLKQSTKGFLNGQFTGKSLLQFTRKTQELCILPKISNAVMEECDGIFL